MVDPEPQLIPGIVIDLSASGSNESIDGGGGNDVLSSGSGNDEIIGGGGNDTLVGNAGNDTLNAGSGNDTVFAGAGDDFIVGGSGAGDDSYNGGAGTDTLSYTSTSAGILVDTLNETATGPEIDQDSFSDIEVIIGGDGDDTFSGGPGNFSFTGGLGVDTLDYQFATNSVHIDLLTQAAVGADIGTDTFTGFEKAFGGAGDDTLIGGSGADTLIGKAGFDTLDGGLGDDTLFGGSGDDILIGGIGSDEYIGGAGFDRLSFITVTEGLSINVDTGGGTGTVVDLSGTLGVNATFSEIEFVEGSSAGDTIFGGAGDDTIDGSGGTDNVSGGAGDDTIGFDTSSETLDGGAGQDKIILFGSNQLVDAANLANVTSIEEIDLSGIGSNTFTATAGLVQTISGTGTLSVFGDGDDIVESSDSWDLIGPSSLGTLTLDRFVNGAGTLDTSVLVFDNTGVINFSAGASFSNSMLNDGALTSSDGTYTNNGVIVLGVAGSIDTSGAATLAGTGLFSIEGSLSVQDDTIAAGAIVDGNVGTIGLEGTVIIDGELILGTATTVDGASAVTLTGAGTLVNQGAHEIDDAPVFAVDTLINQGLFTFSTLTPTITSGTIVNEAGATLAFQVDATVDMLAGQTVTNDGLLTVSSSHLTFLDGIIENASDLNLANGASTLTVTNGTISMQAGSNVVGNGKLVLNNADFDVGVGAGFTLGAVGSGPSIEMVVGNISGAGTFVNESNLVIDGATSISTATFTNSNGGTLDHADGLLVVSTTAFENQTGGTVLVDTSTSGSTAIDFAGDFANAGLIQFSGPNTGTITVGGGAGTIDNSGGFIQVLDGDHILDAGLVNPAGGGIEIIAGGAGLARLTHEVAFTNDGLIHLSTAGSGTQTAILNQGTGFTLTNNGTILLDGGIAGDVLELSGDLNNTGTFEVNSPGESRLVPATGFDATMVNSGTINVSPVSDFKIGIFGAVGNTDFTNTGVIDIAAGGALTLLQNTLTHTGVLNIGTGASLRVEADSIVNLDTNFTLLTGGTLALGDGVNTATFGGTGTLINQGTLMLDNGTLTGNFVNDTGAISVSGTNNLNSGVLDFDSSTTVTFLSGSDKFSNNGTIDVNNSSTLTLDTGTLHNLAGGTITVFAAGTLDLISGAVFQDDGTTTFGASPGSLTISGDMLRGDTSRLLIELGGLVPGIHDGFDQLSISGRLDAGGILDVVEFGTFDVSAGDSFDIINAGTLTGSFREIAGLDVGGGVVLDATQSTTGVTLTGRAVTHQGTAGNDTLTGTAGDDVFVGDSGSDFIVGGGGADLMHGGDGDDFFEAPDTGFGRIDGGGGIDTVAFDGGSFDLTTLRGDQLSNIERLDITGTGNNTLTLDGEIALAAASGINPVTGVLDSLIIDGNSGDVLLAEGGWTNTGTVTIDGNGYSVFQSDTNNAEIHVDTDIAVTLA